LRKYFILLSFILASSLFLKAQTGTAKIITITDWLQLTDTTFGFTISYPAKWTLKLPNSDTRFFFTSPLTGENDNFKENVNCIARKIKEKGLTILMAKDKIKESLANKIQNFKMINATESKWLGADVMELEYSGINESEGVKYNVHFLQRMAVINDTLFTLTFTAEDLQYENYVGIIKKIFDSFNLK
jgi:hypothetical protein